MRRMPVVKPAQDLAPVETVFPRRKPDVAPQRIRQLAWIEGNAAMMCGAGLNVHQVSGESAERGENRREDRSRHDRLLEPSFLPAIHMRLQTLADQLNVA
jgi:hypothetical protein